MLHVSDPRVRLIKKEDSRLKAIASVTIDECFVIHDIKVVEGRDGFFLQMPNKKNLEGNYTDIVHPLNNETREQLKDLIMAEYEKEQAKAQE